MDIMCVDIMCVDIMCVDIMCVDIMCVDIMCEFIHSIQIPIHVDAASGGFIAPFINPELVVPFMPLLSLSLDCSLTVSFSLSTFSTTPPVGLPPSTRQIHQRVRS